MFFDILKREKRKMKKQKQKEKEKQKVSFLILPLLFSVFSHHFLLERHSYRTKALCFRLFVGF
jgi:hypothetical protein